MHTLLPRAALLNHGQSRAVGLRDTRDEPSACFCMVTDGLFSDSHGSQALRVPLSASGPLSSFKERAWQALPPSFFFIFCSLSF